MSAIAPRRSAVKPKPVLEADVGPVLMEGSITLDATALETPEFELYAFISFFGGKSVPQEDIPTSKLFAVWVALCGQFATLKKHGTHNDFAKSLRFLCKHGFITIKPAGIDFVVSSPIKGVKINHRKWTVSDSFVDQVKRARMKAWPDKS